MELKRGKDMILAEDRKGKKWCMNPESKVKREREGGDDIYELGCEI